MRYSLVLLLSIFCVSCGPRASQEFQTASSPTDPVERTREYCNSINEKKYLSLAKFVDNTPHEDRLFYRGNEIKVSSAPTFAHAVQNGIVQNWKDIGVALPTKGTPIEIRLEEIEAKGIDTLGQWRFRLTFKNLETGEVFKLASVYTFPASDNPISMSRILAEKFEDGIAEMVEDMNNHPEFRELVGAPRIVLPPEPTYTSQNSSPQGFKGRPRSVPFRAPRRD